MEKVAEAWQRHEGNRRRVVFQGRFVSRCLLVLLSCGFTLSVFRYRSVTLLLGVPRCVYTGLCRLQRWRHMLQLGFYDSAGQIVLPR